MINRYFRITIPILILAIILGSCKTSSDVTSHRLIQKRKYQKGFHFNGIGKHNSSNHVINSITQSNSEQEESIVKQEFLKEESNNPIIRSKTVSNLRLSQQIRNKPFKESKKLLLSRPNLIQEGDSVKLKVGEEKEKVAENLGLVGVLIGSLSMPIGMYPVGALALIFGLISLKRLKDNPEKYYSDKTLAYVSIGLGLINLLLTILIVALIILFYAFMIQAINDF